MNRKPSIDNDKNSKSDISERQSVLCINSYADLIMCFHFQFIQTTVLNPVQTYIYLKIILNPLFLNFSENLVDK